MVGFSRIWDVLGASAWKYSVGLVAYEAFAVLVLFSHAGFSFISHDMSPCVLVVLYVEMLQLSPKLYLSWAPFLRKPEPFYLVSVITKLINVFGSIDSSVENAVGWLKLGK